MPKISPSSSPAAKKPKQAKARPTQEEIALRAYHIFLERGSTPGNPLEDWLRAEQELRTVKPKKPSVRRKSNVTSIAA